MNKFNVFLIAVKKIKNWPVYIKDYLKIQKGRIVYELYDGSKYEIRGGSNDRNIFNEILIHKLYNPRGFEINERDVVVDIGAHIGIFSIFASKNASKVYSFEPMPENFKILSENIRINNAKNIVALNEAVASKTSEKELFIDSKNKGGHSFYFDLQKKDKKVLVKTVSLEDFILKNNIPRIDFLKIDCEGAEYDILRSCSKKLLSRIRKISMEYHDIDEKYNFKKMRSFLEDHKFSVKVIEPLNMLYAVNIND